MVGICRVLSLFIVCVAVAANAQGVTVSEQYLFAAANQERISRRLRPLHFDPLLAQAAWSHAREMGKRGSISHQFSGEPDLARRVDSLGVRFSLVTENVAQASSSALIHELWMQSSGHRANLLDPEVDSVGIAVFAQHGQLYAVEDFARTVPNLPLAQQEDIVGDLLVRAGVRVLNDKQDARETCMMQTGAAGRPPRFVMRYTSASLTSLPEELTARILSGQIREAAVGACMGSGSGPFTSYRIAVLLYR